jgi:HSP20 family protein
MTTTTPTTTHEPARAGRTYRPNVDILERPDELVVQADLPGARSDTIDVRYEKGILTIHAEVAPRQDENQRFLLREYRLGSFHRSFELSEMIDSDEISADFVDGVLTLHLPKVKAARPRQIAVRTG